ncbi:MAG: dihydrolipoyl dehydrogenase [Chloroflexi bacterium]|nr:dihydrolipoyl dehydrogenase [Chloroflexota bacterium]
MVYADTRQATIGDIRIAIIGAGPGGYVAALRAAQLGARVALMEKEYIGGVCLNVGCIPTKALLRGAEVLNLVREAHRFGIQVGDISYDWGRLQAHKQHVVETMVRGVRLLLERAGIELIEGEARFLRANTLRVRTADDEQTVEADKIIVATGSRPLKVPIPGLEGPRVLDSTAALALDRPPQSICIIGGGAIGLEWASLFNAFGAQVTLVEMLPRLAPLMDASIGEGLAWTFEQQGIDVRTGTRVIKIEQGELGCAVSMASEGGEERVECELVLSAIGRAPNVENLGLEELGIRPSRKGIAVDNRMRTVVPHIYAIGDVAAEGPMLAHVASHQGIVAVEDALGHPAVMDYSAVPSCIFSLPEAASVGLTEEQAREAGYEVQVGIFALQNNGKAQAYGDTNGFVKVVAEAEYGAVLGLHIVGPHASDMIQEGTALVGLEATLDEVEDLIHPHPTLTEAIQEAALAARKRALHLPAR